MLDIGRICLLMILHINDEILLELAFCKPYWITAMTSQAHLPQFQRTNFELIELDECTPKSMTNGCFQYNGKFYILTFQYQNPLQIRFVSEYIFKLNGMCGFQYNKIRDNKLFLNDNGGWMVICDDFTDY